MDKKHYGISRVEVYITRPPFILKHELHPTLENELPLRWLRCENEAKLACWSGGYNSIEEAVTSLIRGEAEFGEPSLKIWEDYGARAILNPQSPKYMVSFGFGT